MKKTLTVLILFAFNFAKAQNNKPDTIKVGGLIIINENKKSNPNDTRDEEKEDQRKRREKKERNRSKTETDWGLFDFGINNFIDKTDYTTPAAKNFARTIKPGEAAFTESDFNLKTIKSNNFNIWFVMNRTSLAKHYVNLKYGIGIENNNYHFENNLSFVKTNTPFVFRDSLSFNKNKLVTQYLTVPIMLNINLAPRNNDGLSFSGGVSAGYLIRSRTKQVSDIKGKQKVEGDFDLEKFKFQYQAELRLGGIMIYGSYAPKSIFERGLDFRSYNIGFRIGSWD